MATLKYKTKNGDYKTLDLIIAAPGAGEVQLLPTTGTSTVAGMTQNAITEELNKKMNTADCSVTQHVTSGATLASVKLNGTTQTIYAPNGSVDKKGIVQLSSSTSSTSTTLAATPSAVKSAYDLAASKVSKVKINGSEKSPDSNGVVDLGTISAGGDYLPLSGGTITGTLEIKRNAAAIHYYNADGTSWGWMGFGDKDTPQIWDSNGVNQKIILHTGNIGSYALTSLPSHTHDYLPLSGGTLTGALTVKGGQYDGNYGLNMANSDIIGVNSIIMSDAAEAATEGIRFVNGSTHDSIWAKSGVLYFTPQMSTNNVVIHSGNIGSYAATQSWVQSQGYKTTDSDTKMTQTADTSNTNYLPILCSASTNPNGAATTAKYHTGVYCVLASKYIYASAYYETSDETLKNFKSDIVVDLDKLGNIPKKYFTWKSGENKDMQIGTSAQEVQKIYPELVTEGADGKLNVDYAKLSIVALAAIDKLNEKNKELETRLSQLENGKNNNI